MPLFARSPMVEFHTHPDDILVHVMPGSQYSTKVLAGLESRDLPHYLTFVQVNPQDRQLPTHTRAVPALEYKSCGVEDSSAILKFVDQHLPDQVPKFYPEDLRKQIDEADVECETVLDAICGFYNYVDPDSYAASLRKSLSTYIPWWAFWVNIDDRLAGKRQEAKDACERYLPELNSDVQMYNAKLMQVLAKYDAILKAQPDGSPPFLFEAPAPTIADCALYSKIARITDQLGDVTIGSAHHTVLEDSDLEALKAWFKVMQQRCPLKWKGKRLVK